MKYIGLIGYGCVGQGFYEILKRKYPEVKVQHIIVKDKNKKRPAGLPISFDVEEVIYNPLITIIAEAIDDSKAALIYALKILEQGKTLVTANKKMVAENLPILVEYTRKYGGRIFYEAAVAGSIPVIQTIKDYYKSEEIESISGILNGSTNYILTLMSEQGFNYEEALIKAQLQGFAESDPTLDVEGFDAVNKLTILIYEAFGQYIAPQNISTTGITEITLKDLARAKSESKKIKLIARADFQDGQLSMSVKPEIIGADNPLFQVDFEYNSVVINGKFSGIQQLTGKGAGSLPTGLAVVSDVVRERAYQAAISGFDENLYVSQE